MLSGNAALSALPQFRIPHYELRIILYPILPSCTVFVKGELRNGGYAKTIHAAARFFWDEKSLQRLKFPLEH